MCADPLTLISGVSPLRSTPAFPRRIPLNWYVLVLRKHIEPFSYPLIIS